MIEVKRIICCTAWDILTDLWACIITVLLDNFKNTQFCLPRGVNWKPLARITVDFLEKHPELQHQPQEALTVMALSESFPCRQEAAK